MPRRCRRGFAAVARRALGPPGDGAGPGDPGRVGRRARHPARHRMGRGRSGHARRHRHADLFGVPGHRSHHDVDSRRPVGGGRRARPDRNATLPGVDDRLDDGGSQAQAHATTASRRRTARTRCPRQPRSTCPASARCGAAPAVACPRCGSTRTQLVSQFGSTACKAHYRCLACLEPFDYFKPH